MRYENRTFLPGELAGTVQDAQFKSCNFTGPLPDFKNCEFHECWFRECAVGRINYCKLFSTNFVVCDFTKADLCYSITAPSSPCKFAGCKWPGVNLTLDCGLLGGMDFGSEMDAYLLAILATVPISTRKKEIWDALPRPAKIIAQKVLNLNFRTR